ncbi:hypothetical protein [Acidipropionibacterium timonense]|uniref:hypothetical protein n=1 Tax=Acidipropionibacterium timonense TaxID=2161818 RepID=UPI0010314122|nr:hypothetical protein [Acidipropionibacterium timonense]
MIRQTFHLDAELVAVPGGTRVLAADGRCWLLTGATRDDVAALRLPRALVDALLGTGIVRAPRHRSVAVVGSCGAADDLARRLGADPGLDCSFVDAAPGLGRPATWLTLGLDHRRHPTDLAVVWPDDPLGSRRLVDLLWRRGIPVVVAWGTTSTGFVGPTSVRGHAVCQSCLDLSLAGRDASWTSTVASVRTTSCAPWVLDHLTTEIARRSTGSPCPDWAAWSRSGVRRGTVPVSPDCHRCHEGASEEEPWSTASRSVA